MDLGVLKATSIFKADHGRRLQIKLLWVATVKVSGLDAIIAGIFQDGIFFEDLLQFINLILWLKIFVLIPVINDAIHYLEHFFVNVCLEVP